MRDKIHGEPGLIEGQAEQPILTEKKESIKTIETPVSQGQRVPDEETN